MDSPGSRPAEGHRWRRRRTDWYYIAGRGAHGSQFIRASRTNCQPAESSEMTGKGANPQEQIPCPQCGRHVQRRKHEKAPEEPARRGTATKARLPFLFAGGAQDVLHLPGLEEPSTHDSRSVFRGRRPVGPGRSTLPDSSWIDGSDSTTSRGTRTTGPISGSLLCGSTMAHTRAESKGSRREHHLPSAFLTRRVRRPTAR